MSSTAVSRHAPRVFEPVVNVPPSRMSPPAGAFDSLDVSAVVVGAARFVEDRRLRLMRLLLASRSEVARSIPDDRR